MSEGHPLLARLRLQMERERSSILEAMAGGLTRKGYWYRVGEIGAYDWFLKTIREAEANWLINDEESEE